MEIVSVDMLFPVKLIRKSGEGVVWENIVFLDMATKKAYLVNHWTEIESDREAIFEKMEEMTAAAFTAPDAAEIREKMISGYKELGDGSQSTESERELR